MQAGVRRYPEPKLLGQHLQKPGREADLKLAPMYKAPHYRGSKKLQNMVALITGGDSGIGRAVAVLFAREGADVAIAYLDEHDDAAETKRAVEGEGQRCIVFSGDVASSSFCRAAVKKTLEAFGRLDILGQQCRISGARRQIRRPLGRALRSNHQDKPVRLLPYDEGRGACDEERRLYRDDRLGHRIARQQGLAGLLDDQGGHPCFCPVAGHAPY